MWGLLPDVFLHMILIQISLWLHCAIPVNHIQKHCQMIIRYSSVRPLGGVHGHHLAPSYHNIIFHHHQPISCIHHFTHHLIIPHLHFMHPSHYHFSSPFFFTSFFSSKKIPHFIFHYHLIHHPTPPKGLS